MKRIKIVLSSIISLILLASCATTTVESQSKTTSNHKSPSREIETKKETAEDIFIKSLEGITISKVSSPKEISKGRSFSDPFVFSAKKADGSALEGFALTLEYPVSKSLDGISFEKTDFITDAEGNIYFTPQQTTFAVKTRVNVYPTPISDDPSLSERLKPYTASAEWKVKSDIASKGAVLFIWDYNEKDRPVNNSYNIQAEFRGRGITMVGNGPVNETSYIGKPKALYKDTYDIIGGTQYGYLIYGTIKFEQPVTESEDGNGYFCLLKAEIEAVSMKNGSKIYSSVITYESKGKNWNECVSKGKDKLSQLVVDDIIYGL
jgi:hypothetical protein